MADSAIAILEGLREPPVVEQRPQSPTSPETRVNTWLVLGGGIAAFLVGFKYAQTQRS
jgi:hypothetical protein